MNAIHGNVDPTSHNVDPHTLRGPNSPIVAGLGVISARAEVSPVPRIANAAPDSVELAAEPHRRAERANELLGVRPSQPVNEESWRTDEEDI